MTQTCIEQNRAELSCRLVSLADKYITATNIGSSCVDKLGTKMIELSYLLKVACLFYEDETCLTDAQICAIFHHVENTLNNNGVFKC